MILITCSIKEQLICLFDLVNDKPWPTVGLMMYRPTVNPHFQPEYLSAYAVYTNCMHYVCGSPLFVCMNVGAKLL